MNGLDKMSVERVRAFGLLCGLRGEGIDVEIEDLEGLPVERMTGEIGVDCLIGFLKNILEFPEAEQGVYTTSDVGEITIYLNDTFDYGIVESVGISFNGLDIPAVVHFDVKAPTLAGFDLPEDRRRRIVGAIIQYAVFVAIQERRRRDAVQPFASSQPALH